MIEYKMVNIDQRKREIIEHLSGAPNADMVVPMQDRVIIADLVMSGVEKAMASLNVHLDATAPVLSNPEAVGALVLMQVMEIGQVMQGIAHQIGTSHLSAMLSDPEGIAMVMDSLGKHPEVAALMKEMFGR